MSHLYRGAKLLAIAATAFVTAIILVSLAGVAWAADGAAGEAPSALAQFTEMAFQVLTPVVVIFATWAAHRVIVVLEKKTGMDVDDSREQQIDFWLEKGIYFAEEKSRKLVKEKAQKLKGNEKLEEAAGYALEQIQKRKWDNWTSAQLQKRAEALLGLKRAAGTKPELDKDAE